MRLEGRREDMGEETGEGITHAQMCPPNDEFLIVNPTDLCRILNVSASFSCLVHTICFRPSPSREFWFAWVSEAWEPWRGKD